MSSLEILSRAAADFLAASAFRAAAVSPALTSASAAVTALTAPSRAATARVILASPLFTAAPASPAAFFAAASAVAAASAAFFAAAYLAEATSRSFSASARRWVSRSNRSASVGGFMSSVPTRFPSAAFQTRISPVQSPATTRFPSWLRTASSARSLNASNSRFRPPFPSHKRTRWSRPAVTIIPFLAYSTEATALCARQFRTRFPLCISQSMTWPSSLDVATTFESARQLMSVMHDRWPLSV